MKRTRQISQAFVQKEELYGKYILHWRFDDGVEQTMTFESEIAALLFLVYLTLNDFF